MKHKILNLALILTSLIGYLEWGGGNSMYLFQGEADIVRRLFTDPGSAIHPFTVLPLLGQILLLIALFQKKPSWILTFTGIGLIGILLFFILFIGLLGLNFRILLSSLPFAVVAVWAVVLYRREKRRK